MLAKFWNFFPELPNSRSSGEIHLITEIESKVFRWFKFTLKTPYSIVCGKLQLAIWDTSFGTFWLKCGHKGP